MSKAPPPTRAGDDADVLFGETLADPYRWLEDVDDPEVQAWMDAQDRHARQLLGGLSERASLADRFRQLFYYDAVSPPIRRGDRLFYSRKRSDREKVIVYWREGDDGDEHVLFDPNEMSEDGSISLGVWVPTRDGKRVAYALRENNADAATLYVRDIDSGSDLEPDVIEGAKYASPSWLPDGSGFYYTWLPTDPAIDVSDLPGYAEVRFHQIGTDPRYDEIVHPATGSARTFISGFVSRDGRWLTVHISHGWNSTDVFLADREADHTDFEPLVTKVDALFEVSVWRDHVYVLTNEGAPRFRVMRGSLGTPTRESWTELVAESDATLESARIIGDHLVLSYLRDARSEVVLHDLDGNRVREIELPGIGTVGGFTGDKDEIDAYYSYSSFTEPSKIFHIQLPDGKPTLWARVDMDVNTDRIVAEQVRYASKDGTEITMFVLRRDDVQPNGDNPTVLYGYGGFSVSLTPSFSPGIVPWLERGGVYAVPNLRGGGEYGEDWHRAGMLDNKQNVFDDFIAAAEWLIDNGWTRPERLAIRGGSNGGLLVGAAMTQRPDLFGAVVCAVPLLDMLRYHLFGSGETWVPEYGDPEDEEQFAVLRAYSPYHQLREGTEYPSLLMLAADSDDRVDPMHARKFVARVRATTTSDRPVILRIERQAGHGGADKVAEQVEQAADSYAYLLDQIG